MNDKTQPANPHYIAPADETAVLQLRAPLSEEDRIEHAKLLARRARLRVEIQLDLNTIRHWNRLHPDQPIDDAFEVAMLAFLDGKGPMPTPPAPSVPDA